MGFIYLLKRLFVALLVIALFVAVIHVWLSSKKYVFTEEAVSNVAKKHVLSGKAAPLPADIKAAYAKVYKDLRAKYPGHILPESDLQWMFVNAGGWMASMCLLHASLTEYVLFFGTAIDTAGHSGRYWANISDTLLTGEFRQWSEGEMSASVHLPGKLVLHEWGSVTQVEFKSGTWMVEYGRGFIPSALGFTLADTFFSTQDFVNLFYILRIYAKALFLEASYYVAHMDELFA